MPFYVLSFLRHACGLPISLSDPCHSHLTSISLRCFWCQHCSWLYVFCILQHSFSINSRPWICSAQNSHEDSCLCWCWNWHIYHLRSHCVQNRIMSLAHSSFVKVTGSPLVICMVSVSPTKHHAALLTVWKSGVLHKWETCLQNMVNLHVFVAVIEWVVGHSSCKLFSLSQRRALMVLLCYYLFFSYFIVSVKP